MKCSCSMRACITFSKSEDAKSKLSFCKFVNHPWTVNAEPRRLAQWCSQQQLKEHDHLSCKFSRNIMEV